LQLGRYQILKQLATGDVANVLLARASGLEGFARHVVIKCIRKEFLSEQQLVASFVEEARIAASLHHHNVVQVHDIGEQDGAVFFAMEYVHGEDVRQLLAKVRARKEQVPFEHVIAIVAATAAGLHHAHEQRSPSGEHLGLVHRDVCPANILIGYDGSVKLVDFGMAKAALRSTKTASGSLKVKASYMSPEQCVGKPVDRRTDTFALGIVLYELLTAQRLFKASNEFTTMAAIVDGTVPPPSTIRPDIPPALDEIAMRALAKEPEARYQTAEDLRAALERFAVDQQLRTSNKALSDYFTALFGQRLEPWHADAEAKAAADFDTSGVAEAKTETDLIAKHAPRRTSPIMMAQSIAEAEAEHAADPVPARSVDDEWGDDDEHVSTEARRLSQQQTPKRKRDQEPTRNERPASPLPAVIAPVIPHPITDDEPGSRTIVAAPIFEDEESTVARDDKEVEAAALLGLHRAPTQDGAVRRPPTEDDDEAVSTLPGMLDRRTLPPSPIEPPMAEPPPLDPPTLEPPTLEPPPSRKKKTTTDVTDDMVEGQQPRPRGLGEQIYVGPPAPRGGFIEKLFGTYRRTIFIGATSGVLVVALTMLAARSCRSGHASPPAHTTTKSPTGGGSTR